MTAQKTALFISSATLAICVALIWYGYMVISKVTDIEEHWVYYNKEATSSSYALSRISNELGYGGLIHNFKNYILHQDDKFLPAIEENLNETYRAISDYKSLEIDPEERLALSKLSHIVDIYSAKYRFAQELIAQGSSPREVEINVQINDEPALEAIAFLAKHAVSRSQSTENETNEVLQTTLATMKIGYISIPFIIIFGGVLIFFIQRMSSANQSLQNAQQYADHLIESAPDPWLLVDENGQIVRVNSQAEKLFGYDREEFKHLRIESLLPERMRMSHIPLRDHFIKKPEFRSLEERTADLVAIDCAGHEFPVEINLGYTYKDGKIQILSAIRDITQRRKVEERQRLAEKIFESAAEAIVILDENMQVIDVNEAFCLLSNFSRTQSIQKTPITLFPKILNKRLLVKIRSQLKKNKKWNGELSLHSKSGVDIPVRVSINDVKDSQGKIANYFAIFSDITLQKQQEKHLHQLANYDALTGLPNRLMLVDRFQNASARAKRRNLKIAVCYIDLDGFKAVNDNFGHESGDDVLREISRLIKNSIREEDTVARLGGDEFIVLLTELPDIDIVSTLAKRILKNLHVVSTRLAEQLVVTGSIGIAVYPDHGQGFDELLNIADQAMYQAKQQGKARYVLNDRQT